MASPSQSSGSGPDPTLLASIYAPAIPISISTPQLLHRLAFLTQFPSFSSLTNPSTSTSHPTSESTPLRVLEIGCGQGDTTACLLSLSPRVHVIALDPGPPDYGRPLTLAAAQSLVREHFGGHRTIFIRSDAPGYVHGLYAEQDPKQTDLRNIIAKKRKPFAAAVIAKSLWYFPSRAAVLETLHAAARAAERVCIAEYALTAANPAAEPHVLATRAQAALYHAVEAVEARERDSAAHGTVPAQGSGGTSLTERFLSEGSNLRVALTPVEIRELALRAGLRLVSEGVVQCSDDAELQDGGWDSSSVVLGDRFGKRIDRVRAVAKQCAARGDVDGDDVEIHLQEAIRCQRLAVAAVKGLARHMQGGGAGEQDAEDEHERTRSGMALVRTMDVWFGEFESMQ